MENPFDGVPVMVAFKNVIIYQGKLREEIPPGFQGPGILLKAWDREGIILDDGAFVPMSNVLFIRPHPEHIISVIEEQRMGGE
jgi:hypothetical protein